MNSRMVPSSKHAYLLSEAIFVNMIFLHANNVFTKPFKGEI